MRGVELVVVNRSTHIDLIQNDTIMRGHQSMNKQESLELYDQGREAWNNWAEERLAERKEIETGQLSLRTPERRMGVWQDSAKADFRGHHFKEDANFENFIFPGDTDFSRSDIAVERGGIPPTTVFSGKAYFNKCKFHGEANFSHSEFEDSAFFQRTKFDDNCLFETVIFGRGALFRNVEIKWDADFRSSQFKGVGDFRGAIFCGDLIFQSIVFEDKAYFNSAVIKGDANFNGSVYKSTVSGASAPYFHHYS